MKIGIVGGSIAGCSAAFLLQKEGYQVSVFERSNKALVGRGGGIGTTPSLMEEIRQDGLIGEDFAFFQVNKMPLVGKHPDFEPFGRTAWAMPINFQVFQWNELWRHLRLNIPDENYHAGTKITDAKPRTDGAIELTTSEGKKESFDLVLFADGYNSLGRRILFPEKKLKYRGYVLWRGLLPEASMDGGCPLRDEILRLSYVGRPGHNVVYYIPDHQGVVRKGQRIFNWAAYVTIPENELGGLMTDKDGKSREGTMPPGYLNAENENRLKAYLAENIPDYYGEVVNRTINSYIQVIYTLDLDQYHKDNIALIGDAGIVVQPFTGSGVFKGYHNVKDLIRCLKKNDNLATALEEWDHLQLLSGRRLLALGEQMEKAFIWEQPDFAKVDESFLTSWWRSSVSFPEDFDYQKG